MAARYSRRGEIGLGGRFGVSAGAAVRAGEGLHAPLPSSGAPSFLQRDFEPVSAGTSARWASNRNCTPNFRVDSDSTASRYHACEPPLRVVD